MRFFVLLFSLFFVFGCDFSGISSGKTTNTKSNVKNVNVNIETNENGLTTEQENVAEKLKDEADGSKIRHLYLVSAYSGDVLVYSTVKGKITSSGKRLKPYTVEAGAVIDDTGNIHTYGMNVVIDGKKYKTSEVRQDDGTYGHSMEYLYWKDVNGISRRTYITGGVLPIVSDEPMSFPKIILNLDSSWTPPKDKKENQKTE